MIIGGPPCQGYSAKGKKLGLKDPRNFLFREYLNIVKELQPSVFVIENVKGLLLTTNGWFKDEILRAIRNLGYFVEVGILNAMDFGVPQHRERFIVVGNRLGINPEAVFDEIFKSKQKPFVLKNALEGLPKLGTKKIKGKNDIEDSNTGFTECDFEYTENDFYHFINGNKKLHKLYNHKNRYNNPRDIEIYTRLPQGANSLHESITDIMPYKSRNDIFKDKYFKLEEDKICKTITSHMRFDCNMYIHPWFSRGLSPREAARIQTFPDDYIFYGSQNSWYAQIGNAVPVKLAYAIGKGIAKFL